jgi:hypothetical protein
MSSSNLTMKLITTNWQNQKSFRLIPVSNDCPYSEGIYDPDSKVLVLMSVIRKETFHMVPRLDDNGDMAPVKGAPRKNGKPYKEERKTLETFTEYYIQEKAEIEEAIKELAVNAATYDYDQYLIDKKVIVPEKPKVLLT